MKKATDPPPYPPLKNIGFMLGMIARWDKAIFLLGALLIPALVVLPLLSIYLSKVVVEAVTTAADPLDFVLIVLLFSASIFLCNVIINVCDDILRSRSTLIRFRYINLCSEKIMDTDFANIESSEGQDKMNRVAVLGHVWYHRIWSDYIFTQPLYHTSHSRQHGRRLPCG